MWNRNLHVNIVTCIWVVRNALIKGERLTRNRRGCSCWSWGTTSISCLHKYHQMDRCTTTTSKQLTSKRTRNFKHGRELCWVVIMQCWIFPYASFGRVTSKPRWDARQILFKIVHKIQSLKWKNSPAQWAWKHHICAYCKWNEMQSWYFHNLDTPSHLQRSHLALHRRAQTIVSKSLPAALLVKCYSRHWAQISGLQQTSQIQKHWNLPLASYCRIMHAQSRKANPAYLLYAFWNHFPPQSFQVP